MLALVCCKPGFRFGHTLLQMNCLTKILLLCLCDTEIIVFEDDLFYVYECFSLLERLFTTCVQCLQKPEKGIGSLRPVHYPGTWQFG